MGHFARTLRPTHRHHRTVKNYEPFKPGTKAAGYNVLLELGRGAASAIYLVQDPKSKQVWALKHVVRETPKDQRFLDQTEREHEVLMEVAQGANNTEIGQRLYMAEGTVKTHIGRLLAKLGARDRVSLVLIAHQAGMLD